MHVSSPIGRDVWNIKALVMTRRSSVWLEGVLQSSGTKQKYFLTQDQSFRKPFRSGFKAIQAIMHRDLEFRMDHNCAKTCWPWWIAATKHWMFLGMFHAKRLLVTSWVWAFVDWGPRSKKCMYQCGFNGYQITVKSRFEQGKADSRVRWFREHYKIVRIKYVQMYSKIVMANLAAMVNVCMY